MAISICVHNIKIFIIKRQEESFCIPVDFHLLAFTSSFQSKWRSLPTTAVFGLFPTLANPRRINDPICRAENHTCHSQHLTKGRLTNVNHSIYQDLLYPPPPFMVSSNKSRTKFILLPSPPSPTSLRILLYSLSLVSVLCFPINFLCLLRENISCLTNVLVLPLWIR